jgi:hypothetical protein
VAYVWWYDHEGAIQSHGINFVLDLPYFLVLLLTFQRFSMDNWGIVSEFDHPTEKDNETKFSFSPPPTTNNNKTNDSFPPINLVIKKTDKIHDHYGIVGRATRVLEVKDLALVLKVYWPEASRVSEERTIEQAAIISDRVEDVKGHLPELIRSCDLENYSTDKIRNALGIASGGRRVLRVILFRKLYPITDLIGEEFWTVFWECFRCECVYTSLVNI